MFNIFMSPDMRVRAPGKDRSTLDNENLVHDDLIRIVKEIIMGVRDEDVPTFAKCFHCGSCIGCSAFREFQY
jgi:heterodisulfide reductase subunit C